jgi:hypothetical protein
VRVVQLVFASCPLPHYFAILPQRIQGAHNSRFIDSYPPKNSNAAKSLTYRRYFDRISITRQGILRSRQHWQTVTIVGQPFARAIVTPASKASPTAWVTPPHQLCAGLVGRSNTSASLEIDRALARRRVPSQRRDEPCVRELVSEAAPATRLRRDRSHPCK